MIFGSVCSGIEAASVAWRPLGWRCAFMSEIAPFPCAVLKHHYPDVPLHGDFTTIKAGDYEPIDLLVGGTPCQSFSIAGLRGGLSDSRGNLALEFLRLADRLRPRWIVWENVPGVLSATSHDAPDPCQPPDDMEEGAEWVGEDQYDADENHAFSCFLAGLSELGYGWAYRSLDAQFFGLAQRRERVFVVGYLGSWQRAAAVLLEREGLRGDSPPRREARKESAVATGECAQGFGGGITASTGDISHCLNAGGMGRIDYETETLIAHTLRAEGFDASEDGTGRGTPIVPIAIPSRMSAAQSATTENLAPALGAVNPTAVAFQTSQSGVRAGNVHATLDSNNGSRRHNGALIGSAVRRLTPTEAARLQGFPDDYLDITFRGKPAADGNKYRALGNSFAVPVVRWIGVRINNIEESIRG